MSERDAPTTPKQYTVQAKWVRDMYVLDANEQSANVTRELEAETGTDILILDWTVDAARVYKRRRVLPLPVSMAMQSAGFTDTFRELSPNPVQRPGITWSPMYRTKGEGDEQVEQGFERIDRLYLKNPSSPQNNWILRSSAGHVLPIVWEDDSIPVVDRQFPSDHGALVIDLEWSKASIEIE